MFAGVRPTLQRWKRLALKRQTANRVAAGIAMGMIVGLIPGDSALAYLALVIALLCPVSLIAAALSALVFTMISPSLDTVLDSIGMQVLSMDALMGVWTWLETLPLIAWTRFNNTVVMGSIVFSLVAWLPVFLLMRWLITRFQSAYQVQKNGDKNSSDPRISPSLATELDR